MKIWCTKWALTKGILEMDAEDCGNGMVRIKVQSGGSIYFHSKEWHITEQDAIEHALVMVDKKFEALKRQSKNIEMNQARWRNRREQLKYQL